MRNRGLILIIGAAVAVAAVLVGVYLVTAPRPPAPSPTPTVTATMEPHEGEEELPSGHAHGEWECQPVDLLPGGYCDTGDDLPGEPVVGDMHTQAQQVEPLVRDFVAAWVTTSSSESPEQRQARLTAAGASPEVSAADTALARKNSTQYGLTHTVRLDRVALVVPLRKLDDGWIFSAAVGVTAEYLLPSGSGTNLFMDGSVQVTTDSQGVILDVKDTFDQLAELR